MSALLLYTFHFCVFVFLQYVLKLASNTYRLPQSRNVFAFSQRGNNNQNKKKQQQPPSEYITKN